MIVLFTANEKGGIIQFTFELAKNLIGLKNDVVIYLPSSILVDVNDKDYHVVYYEKIKTLNKNSSGVQDICKKLLLERPSLVWFCDTSVLSCQVNLCLKENILKMMTFHDAGRIHPSWNSGVREGLKHIYEKIIMKKCANRLNYILVLSNESKKTLISSFKNISHKVLVLPLGAHIPAVEPCIPEELSNANIENYYLFFGRIDKYKGLINILEAYDESDINDKFVVAGNGTLTEKENEICNRNANIILIKRYIRDDEMKWLFDKSKAVCLPYIEASQSGVIPIAYKFGKPVITSDVLGLKQFVIDKKTGYVCSDKKDYIASLKLLQDENNCNILGRNARDYYNSELEWGNSLKRILNSIFEKND